MYRLLLSVDYATLSNGVLRYRERVYNPANSPATGICENSPLRATRIKIKIDKSAPYELYIPNKRGTWAHFKISEGGAAEISGVTLDEEEILAPNYKLLYASAEHEARLARVMNNDKRSKTKTGVRAPLIKLSRKDRNAAAAEESDELKSVLSRTQQRPLEATTQKPPSTETWKRYAEEDRLRSIEVTRRRHGLL
jgi:hypothetical protein